MLATSYALSQGIAAIGAFDVILVRQATTDGDTAQVGPALAEHLGLPHAAWVSRLERAEGGLIAYQELQSAIHAVFLPFSLPRHRGAGHLYAPPAQPEAQARNRRGAK